MNLGGGAGALVTTEIEYAELGTHGGHALRGRVERRVLRLALGRERAMLQLRFGRARAVAVEVQDADGRRYDLPLETPPDPWLAAGRRLAVAWLLSALALRLARGARRAAGRPDSAAA